METFVTLLFRAFSICLGAFLFEGVMYFWAPEAPGYAFVLAAMLGAIYMVIPVKD